MTKETPKFKINDYFILTQNGKKRFCMVTKIENEKWVEVRRLRKKKDFKYYKLVEELVPAHYKYFFYDSDDTTEYADIVNVNRQTKFEKISEEFYIKKWEALNEKKILQRIQALEITLKYTQVPDKKKELEQRIKALQITLKYLKK